MMSLLVRNLPPAWGDHDLSRLFGVFGPVARIVFVWDHDSNHSRYAFVDMARCDDAARAVETLNGRRIAKHRLIIENYAPF